MSKGYYFTRRGGYHKKATPYRSGFEDKVITVLKDASIPYTYEKHNINYKIPESEHIYTPDIVLDNNIIVELKGLFEIEDRKKHLLVKEQHPNLDIRFVFQNSSNKIYKGSKTSYGDWCSKNNIKYADKMIPISWFKEPKKSSKGLIKKKTK